MPPLTLSPQYVTTEDPHAIHWRVAGRGELGPGCGEKEGYVCTHCQHVLYVTKQCHLRSCPDCHQLWNCKMASTTKARMERARATFKSRIHHVILSFKEGDINDIQRFRTECYKLLKQFGIDGGGMVLHPWRENHEGDFEVEGIHVHAFVVGQWILPGTSEFTNRAEIIFKRIGDLKYYKQYHYVFEHCGIADKVHAITWFGNMSYRNFPKEDAERMAAGPGRVVRCPECQYDMEKIYIYDSVAQDVVLGDFG